ncbi:hypothetical protein, partial [Klebsiella pneumoniae]|uniref:hypothetical protein n=1 Tax=Klebsiella pneumoniae TaxID=573 RepID=UPI003F92F2BB
PPMALPMASTTINVLPVVISWKPFRRSAQRRWSIAVLDGGSLGRDELPSLLEKYRCRTDA